MMLCATYCRRGKQYCDAIFSKFSTAQKVMTRPSSDMAAFKEEVKTARNILILSGAGVSAESGVPTFRGAGGFWRKWQAQDLASPEAFAAHPSLVWEFYHHRREVVLTKFPNPAHKAIAEFETKMREDGKKVTVVTQNVDELHREAGTKNLVELHGSLFKTRCNSCGNVQENRNSPICEALRNRGEPDIKANSKEIPNSLLPACDLCGAMVRPHVVWFGEGLDKDVLTATMKAVDECDLCLIVGTSSVVYPAAMFAPQVARRGVAVAEFNLEDTDATSYFKYHFSGPAGKTVPAALDLS